MRGDRESCAEAADAARELCLRHGFGYYGHWGAILGAWARAGEDASSAVDTIRSALASLDQEGARARRPIYLAVFAEALDAAGRRDQALAALDQGEEHASSSGDRVWSSELVRLRARMVAPKEATGHARRALELAQSLGARPLVVRSAVTLAEAMRHDPNGAGDVVRSALQALPDAGSSFDRARAMQLIEILG
jgi:hypothetical protein